VVFPSLGKKQRKYFQALDKMRRNSPACGGTSPRLGTDESNESKRTIMKQTLTLLTALLLAPLAALHAAV
jgi:hypothetical protein